MLGGSAVGEYAGRPLKAGDAAQPRGCSARFVPAGFGPFGFPPGSGPLCACCVRAGFVLAEVSVLAGLLIFWVPLLAAGLFLCRCV